MFATLISSHRSYRPVGSSSIEPQWRRDHHERRTLTLGRILHELEQLGRTPATDVNCLQHTQAFLRFVEAGLIR